MISHLSRYVVVPSHLRQILDDDMEVYCEDELDYLVPPEYSGGR